MRRTRLLTAILLLLCLPALALAALDLAAPVPMDPSIVRGELANGLRYYIQRNAKPESRVELRLAVKAGSVLETEAERGLAHFNEHMNFNGTKNFAPGELVSYLESIGARFGADSNAYTSYDETVYILHVPTDKPGVLEKGLLILADWAGRATLADAEIDKERGVVLDELRGGKGASKRIREKQDQVMFRGSRYADRDTIGLEDVIRNATPETVKGYYRRWYRPDLMGVVVVGDVDPKEMEGRIRAVFGELPASSDRTPPPRYPVPPHDETLYSIESDAELTTSSATIRFKLEPHVTRTFGDLRAETVEQLASYLLSTRLQEVGLRPDPPFLSAGGGRSGYVDTLDVFSLNARAKDGQVPRAAAAVWDELNRARQHGFLESELARVKTIILQFAESRYKERDQQRSDDRVWGIVQGFLDDQPVPSDETAFEIAKEIVPSITLAEVNAALRSMTDARSRVVLVQTPAGAGLVPTVEEMRNAFEPEKPRDVAAWVDDATGKPLLETPPPAGTIVSRRAIPELGVHVLVLGNGATVILKPTDFRNDQVVAGGFAHGGAADLARADYLSGLRADSLANSSGVADLTSPQLEKLLNGSGRIASASFNVGTMTRGFGGSARPQDLETMLQLATLRFTRPAFRDEPFERMLAREVERLRNEQNSPQAVYGRAMTEVATSGHWLYRPPTVPEIQALKKADLERLYRAMFDDASEWTFVFVGNVDPETHGPLLAQYLGNLPTLSKTPRASTAASCQELDIRFPEGAVTREVRKGIEDQSRTVLMIDAPHDLDPQAAFEIDAVTDLLEIRLRDRLREERGDTYGAGVSRSTFSPYRKYGRIDVSFGSAPDTRASMVDDVRKEIARLRATPPTEAEVSKLREMRLTALSEAEKENGWWLGQLSSTWLLGRDPMMILEHRKRIDKLTAAQVQAAAVRWLDPQRATAEVWLTPEAPKAAGTLPATAEPAKVPGAPGT